MSSPTKYPLESVNLRTTRTGETGSNSPRNDGRTTHTHNPLDNMSHAELLKDVEDFTNKHNMTKKLDILQTAALIAQDPSAYRRIEELKAADPILYASIYMPTIPDVEALQDEMHNPWHHKQQIPRTIILCSIGAAVQGWDQNALNGANISWPTVLIGKNATMPGYEWLIGVVNAAPWISAGLLGCWISDPLNFYFGRRGCIFISAIFCILPIIGSAFVQRWHLLFICRLLLGLGMGAKATTIPVYMAENSPKSIRGALIMTWQMCVAFGIFLGGCANLAASRAPKDIEWRIQLGVAFIPAVPLLLGVYFCPESPRWYIKKGRYQDAYRSLKRLRNTKLQAARDLYYIHKQLTHQTSFRTPGNGILLSAETAKFTPSQTPQGLRFYFIRLKELFITNRVRQATIASNVVMIAQQMCGINIIAFYSSTIFMDNGESVQGALWCSWGWGLTNLLFAFPALYTIDRWGRRRLLLATFPMLAGMLLLAGLCSLAEQRHVRVGLVTAFVFIYTAFYSTGEGPVPFTYSAEAFPLSHREIGMSLAVSTNFVWAAILSVTFPPMLKAFHAVGAFVFYAGLNVIAFIMIFLLVPETRQRTLEDLDYTFDKPIKEFAAEAMEGLKFHRAKNCRHQQMQHEIFSYTSNISPQITRRLSV